MADLLVTGRSFPDVRPLRVYLVHCHFNEPEEDDLAPPTDFVVDVLLKRASVLDLSIHMTVATTDDAGFLLSVTYGVDYRMSEHVPDEARDHVWRSAAYSLAPALLYPYIREFFSNILVRSLAPEAPLPFLPIPLDLPSEAIQVPPAPPDSGYQTALFDANEVDEHLTRRAMTG